MVVSLKELTDSLIDWSCSHVASDHYHSYMALGTVIPVLLSCMIIFLIFCAVLVYSVRARRRRARLLQARLYHQHQATLHAAGHFDDAVPYGTYLQFHTRLHQMHEMQTIVISVPSICLSCGFAVWTRLNGSRSCLGHRL